MPNCRIFWYLSCLVFSEFSVPVVQWLSLVWGNFHTLLLQIFILLLSHFLLLIFPLHIYVFDNSPTVVEYPFPFFILFSLFAFILGGFFNISVNSLIHTLAFFSLLMIPSKAFLFVQQWFCSFYFLSFYLRVFISLLKLSTYSCMLSPFPLKPLTY